MPSRAEFEELYNQCDWTWKSNYNGISGYLVKGPNNQTIFLPASGYRLNGVLNNHGSDGYYWSSSLYTSDADNAYFLYFGSANFGLGNYSFLVRCFGHSVRPVAEK